MALDCVGTRPIVWLALLGALWLAGEARPDVERITDRIDAAAIALQKCVGFPGMSLSVVRLDRAEPERSLHLARGYGVADVGSGRAVHPGTRFCIGSVTKGFTAALLAQLLADSNGTYNLDTTIKSILGPDFELCTRDRTELTSIRDLLSHRVGIAKHFGGFLMGYNFSRADIVRRIRHLPELKPFRQSRVFNNFMYVIAGQVAEKLNGTWWENQIVNKLFKPLNMSRSTFADRVVDWSDDFAQPHALRDGELVQLKPKVTGNILRPIGPAGSICTTATDMVEWLAVNLLNGTSLRGAPILNSEVVDEMLNIHNLFPTPLSLRNNNLVGESLASGYGLGWVIGSYRGTKRVFHSGFSNYYYSMVSLLPEKGIGIYASINGPHLIKSDNGMKALHFFIMDLLLGHEPWLNESTVCAYPRPWTTTSAANDSSTTKTQSKQSGVALTTKMPVPTDTVIEDLVSTSTSTSESDDWLVYSNTSTTLSTSDEFLISATTETTDTSIDGMLPLSSEGTTTFEPTTESSEQNIMDFSSDVPEITLPALHTKLATQFTTEGIINTEPNVIHQSPKPSITRRRRPSLQHRPLLLVARSRGGNSSISTIKRRPKVLHSVPTKPTASFNEMDILFTGDTPVITPTTESTANQFEDLQTTTKIRQFDNSKTVNRSQRPAIGRQRFNNVRPPFRPKKQRLAATTTEPTTLASTVGLLVNTNKNEESLPITFSTDGPHQFDQDSKFSTTELISSTHVHYETSSKQESEMDPPVTVDENRLRIGPTRQGRYFENSNVDNHDTFSDTITTETPRVATRLLQARRPLRRKSRPRRAVFVDSKISKFEGNYYNPFFGDVVISVNRSSHSLQLNYGYYGKAMLRPLATGTEHIYRMQFFNSIWYQSESDDMKLFTKLGMFDVQFGTSKIDGQIDKLVVFIFDTEKPPLFTKH